MDSSDSDDNVPAANDMHVVDEVWLMMNCVLYTEHGTEDVSNATNRI